MSRLLKRGTLLVVVVFCIAAMTLPAAAASGDTASASDPTVSTLSQSTTESVIDAQSSSDGSVGERIIRYRYVDFENHGVYRFDETPDLSSLPNGEYLEVRTVQTSDTTEERTRTVEVDDGQSSSISSASHNSGPYRLEVLHEHSEYEASYTSGSTVDLWIGAGNETGPIGNTDVTVTVTTPDGDDVEFNRTLGADGNTELSYDTSGGTTGMYDVYVESSDGVSGYGAFRVGPQIKDIFPSWEETITVGSEVDVAMFLTENAEPIPNTQKSVTLQKPDGTEETISVTTDQDGIGRFSFTPTQSGSYRVDANNFYEYFNIEAAQYVGRLYINGDEYGSAVRPGTTVGLSGIVTDSSGPVTQESVSIQLLNDNDEVVADLSATTNAAGSFYTEWEAPDNIDERVSYNIQFQTGDGTSIASGYTDIAVEPVEQSDSGAAPLEVDVETDQYATPGDTLDLQIEAEQGGEAYANEEVTILPSVYYGDVAIDSFTVQTDSSGNANTQYTIPNVPDGSEIEFNANADINGDIEAYDDVNIQQYAIDEEWPYEASAGSSTTYSISVTDVETGDPVSGFPMMLAPEREFGHASVYDSQTVRTNSSGIASTEISIPADASGNNHLGSFSKYDPSNYFNGNEISTFDAELTGLEDYENAAGETLSVTYDGPSGTSATLGVTTYSSDAPTPLATTQLSAGEQFSFTIPTDAPQGTYYQIQGFAVNSDGEIQKLSEWFQVEGTTGNSVRLQPASITASPESSATTDVVIDDVNNGVGAYDFSLTISNTSVATIENIELGGNPGVEDVTISDDGSSATVSASLADTPDSGTVTISNVTYSTANKGSAEIDLEVETIGDEDGSTYPIGTVEGGTIEVVDAADEIPAVVGDTPPTDPDGDDKYEDINGDGSADVVDVQALFSNLDSEVVQNNPAAFDFNNDDGVDVVDVQKLFNDI